MFLTRVYVACADKFPMNVSVVIPVIDEPNINSIVERIHNALSGSVHEVVVVYSDKSHTKPSINNATIIKIFYDSLERES